MTRKKEGLGRWTNLGVGLVGALVGGYLFNVLHIDLGLGDLKVTFEDLIAAVCGSLLFIFALWLIRKYMGKKNVRRVQQRFLLPDRLPFQSLDTVTTDR